MQPAWSPILVQTIAIHALGFVLRRLQLNRHGGAEVRPHTHDHAQLILYLSGEGLQEVNGRRRRARAGDLFLIPPRLAHGFDVVGRSRPVCLVLDYDSSRTPRRARHRPASPQGQVVEFSPRRAMHARAAGHRPQGRDRSLRGRAAQTKMVTHGQKLVETWSKHGRNMVKHGHTW